ncbi:metalloprotease TldD [Basilea psittacipulmonis]|uniref:Protease TldD n=1 Tax=Basilea psittacipulmonis DSM 24701 TaxID=1072685 RepID=A0A077DDH8_9BURK|nr:metalloprotease TldD [Basilea psittacipulmonis]AIL32674.1 protease TldD [Basilea psittacipulmonis DSM 24701]
MNSAISIAKEKLLDPWGLSETDLKQVLDEIMSGHADFADLYFQYACSQVWSLDEGQVKSGGFSISQGVGVRAVSGEKTAYAYSDILSKDSLMQAGKTVKSIAQAQTDSTYPAVNVSTQAIKKYYECVNPLPSWETSRKIQLLESLDTKCRLKSPHVIRVNASLSMDYEVIYIACSDGRRLADIRPLVHLSLSVLMQKGDKKVVARTGGGARRDLDFYTDALIDTYIQEVIDEGHHNLEADEAPAGEMEVVLGNGWPGILLHEAVGHGLEGDFNRKGSSAFSGRIGERVASPGVTVIDDATIQDRRGSLNVDDEGTSTQRTVLIEDGILKGYMQDRLNARLMGSVSTGNCRREDYSYVPMPRMTNTFMMAGHYEPDEMIASVKKGIYAKNFSGGQVNITNGNFTFSASRAYLIENGKITRPIKGATLIGTGADTMNEIGMIGHDLALDPGMGMCGKQGQSVPVGVGMPTIKLNRITVGGTA